MKSHTRVVVIGGGVVGCSVLYHLARMGWSDVILLERKGLAAGSSWHAAGNLFALTSPSNVSELQKYTIELYPQIEAESGQSCGLHLTGGISFARSKAQMEVLQLARSHGRRNGIDCHFISCEEAKDLAPVIDTGGLVGALYEDMKGHVDPHSVTQAFAKAARVHGATIHQQTRVIETNRCSDGGWDVVTDQGTVHTEVVVNAAGLWAREVASLAAIILPLIPVEHHYLVTETVPEIAAMPGELPTMTDAESGWYSRQEGQGLLLGAYESICRHWAVEGTPADFDTELLPDDLGRMEWNVSRAAELLPCLAQAGIKRVVNGPMIFSPDLAPLIGPYPGLDGYFCACGVMTGFNQGGGIGRVLAEWIIEAEPSLDVFCWDVARFGDYANGPFTRERTRYFYEHRMDATFPYQEYSAGRPLKTFPIHDRLKAAGAVFGLSFGWESPLWFAREGEEPVDIPSNRRANWFEAVAEECHGVRNGVGLFEISTFAKYAVRGADAEAWLEHLLANRMPSDNGRTRLSPMLSKSGRMMGDFTVTRLAADHFILLGAGSMQRCHMRHFENHLPATGVALENLSASWTGLHIAGPKARALLADLTEADVGTEAFPFLSGRVLSVATVPEVLTVRVSFTGDLGYELYCPSEYQRTLFAALMQAGAQYGLRLAGSHALMSLRLEKGFPSWGLELSADYGPFDSGLGRFVCLDKKDFIGKQAAVRARREGPEQQLVTLVVDVDETDAWGGEPVYLDGDLAGYVTSGGYGHHVAKSIALAYLAADKVQSQGEYGVEILGRTRPATLIDEPLFDPRGECMRS